MPLPYLQSERHFRKYEPYLRQIVMSWPNPVAFTPQPPVASIETLASRIRICIAALRDNVATDSLWELSFPLERFIEIEDDIVVSTSAQPGKVVCGPSSAVRKKVPLGVQVEPAITQVIPKVRLIKPELDLIMAVIVLHHYKFLSEPSTIITNAEIPSLIGKYDVAVEQTNTNPNEYTIL